MESPDKLSVQFCIDLVDGVKPVINLKNEKFINKISIQEPIVAILEAQKNYSDLALQSNGFRLKSRKLDIAVVQKNISIYSQKSCKLILQKNNNVLNAELWEIFKALGIALRETASRKAYKITVFSNSQMAIRKIQIAKTGVGQALKAQIVEKAKKLEVSRKKVTIRWIPSYSKIKKNELVNKAGKKLLQGKKQV